MNKEQILAVMETMSLEDLTVIDRRVADDVAKAQKLEAFGQFMEANGTDVVEAVVAAIKGSGPQALPPAAQQAIEEMARQLDAAVERAENAEAALAAAQPASDEPEMPEGTETPAAGDSE